MSRRLADTVGPGMSAKRYIALAEEAEHAMAVLSSRLSDTPIGSERDDARQ
jgi:two-component system chemotaxis response regulator CheB